MAAIFTKKRIAWIIGILAVTAVLYFLLPVSIPLIMALLTAILLEPAVRFAGVRFGLKRRNAVLIVFILFVILAGIAGYIATVRVASEALKAANHIPEHFNRLSSYWLGVKEDISTISRDMPKQFVEGLTSRIEQFIGSSRNTLLAYVNIEKIRTLLANIPNLFISFLVYLVALFLFMADIPRLRDSLNRHLTDRTAEKVNDMFSRLSFVVLGFLKGQLLVSILIFVISLLSLYLIVPSAAVTGAFLIWLFDFIPLIGSLIVLGPWALFYALAGNTVAALGLSILAAALIAVRQYLEPKMLGSSLRLSPLLTLASMYLGFKMLGITGIILGPILIIGITSAREAGILKFNFKL